MAKQSKVNDPNAVSVLGLIKKRKRIQKLAGGGPVTNPTVDIAKLSPEQLAIYNSKQTGQDKLDYYNSLFPPAKTPLTPTPIAPNKTDATESAITDQVAGLASKIPGAGVLASVGDIAGNAVKKMGTTTSKDNTSIYATEMGSDALKDAGIGASIGSIFPGAGTIIGAGIGAGVGVLEGDLAAKKDIKNRNAANATDAQNTLASQAGGIYGMRKGGLVKRLAEGGETTDGDGNPVLAKGEKKVNKPGSLLEKTAEPSFFGTIGGGLAGFGATELLYPKDEYKGNYFAKNPSSVMERNSALGALIGGGTPLLINAIKHINQQHKFHEQQEKYHKAAKIAHDVESGEKERIEALRVLEELRKRNFNEPLDPNKESLDPNLDPNKDMTPHAKSKYHKIMEDRGVIGGAKNGGLIQRLMEGGKVEGAGTGKSDSINATIKPGSFVVPAEFEKEAQALREQYLTKKGGKAKKNQPGGTDVRLSHGEHLFTPQEKAILEKNGVDLTKLAPNAEQNFSMKTGGVVPKGYSSGTDENGIPYENNNPNDDKEVGNTNEPINVARQNFLAVNGDWSKLNDFDSKTLKDWVEKNKDDASFQQSEFGKQALASYQKQYTAKDSSTNNDRVPDTNNISNIVKQLYQNKYGKAPNADEQKSFLENEVQTPQEQAQATEGSDNTSTIKTPPGTPTPNKGLNAEQYIALGQAGLGAGMLLDSGKRPVDTIDPSYLKAIAEAQADANSGLTPEERTLAENKIELNRRTVGAEGENIVAGMPSLGLAHIRAATRDASQATANLAGEDARMRLQKKQYASRLLAEKDSRQRQIFEDKMSAFQQNQKAGSEMLYGGINTYLDSMKEKKEQSFYDKWLASQGTKNIN